MTHNKVEEMIERITNKIALEPVVYKGETHFGWRHSVDPHKLAEVLVELEERINNFPCPSCTRTGGDHDGECPHDPGNIEKYRK